jgi:hypothetical protein
VTIKQSIDVGIGQNVEYWKVMALHIHFGDVIRLEVQGYLSLSAADSGLSLPGARRQISIDYDEMKMGTDFEAQINAMLKADDIWKTATSI